MIVFSDFQCATFWNQESDSGSCIVNLPRVCGENIGSGSYQCNVAVVSRIKNDPESIRMRFASTIRNLRDHAVNPESKSYIFQKVVMSCVCLVIFSVNHLQIRNQLVVLVSTIFFDFAARISARCLSSAILGLSPVSENDSQIIQMRFASTIS